MNTNQILRCRVCLSSQNCNEAGVRQLNVMNNQHNSDPEMQTFPIMLHQLDSAGFHLHCNNFTVVLRACTHRVRQLNVMNNETNQILRCRLSNKHNWAQTPVCIGSDTYKIHKHKQRQTYYTHRHTHTHTQKQIHTNQQTHKQTDKKNKTNQKIQKHTSINNKITTQTCA